MTTELIDTTAGAALRTLISQASALAFSEAELDSSLDQLPFETITEAIADLQTEIDGAELSDEDRKEATADLAVLTGELQRREQTAEALAIDESDYEIGEDEEQLACVYCQCTQRNACETPNGPCSWISSDPPVCSAPDCAAALAARRVEEEGSVPAADVDDANPPIAEREATADDDVQADYEIVDYPDRGFPGAAPAVADDRIHQIPLRDIAPDPEQPRDEGADYDLAASIKENGVLQPITVRRHPQAGEQIVGINMRHPLYMIVDGERRFRGAQAAKVLTIPARVVEDTQDDGDRLLHQVLFNEGKRLKPMEEARSWKRIMQAKGWKIQQLAAALGKPKSTVSDRLALLDAPPAFHPYFVDGTLSAAAAPIIRPLAGIDEKTAKRIVDYAITDPEWEDAVNAGKTVPLDVVKRALQEAVRDDLQRVSPELATYYHGPTVSIDGEVYALDQDALDSAWRDSDNDRASRQSPTTTAKVNPDVEKWQKQERERNRKEKEERDRKLKLRAAHFAAVAAKVPRALDADWALLVLREVSHSAWHVSAEALRVMGVPVPEKKTSAGWNTPKLIMQQAEKLDLTGRIRLLLQLVIYDQQAPYQKDDDRLAAAAQLLKLDLKKITEAPDPAAKKPGTALAPIAAPIKKRKAPARVIAKKPKVKKPAAKKATKPTSKRR